MIKDKRIIPVAWFVFNAIIGALWVYGGIRIFVNPTFCWNKYSYCADTSGYNIPLGLVMITIGIISVLTKFKSSFKTKERLLICPTCQQLCPAKDAASDSCPQCSVPLEPLEGFYKRHPELKDDKEQPDC